jgi:outer membrane lipoprotein-sorting protein
VRADACKDRRNAMSDWPLNRSEPEQPEDVLDRALLAMRSEFVPDGPSVELVADTLAALDRAVVDYERPIPLFRRVMTVKNMTISAGVLSAAAAVLLIVATPSTPTLADAIKSVQEAHVVSYTKTETIQFPQSKRSLTRTCKVYERDDGRLRVERDGFATIHDLPAKKYVTLQMKAKIAVVSTTATLVSNAAKWELRPYLDRLQKAIEEPVKDLEEKELAGKKVKGFVARGYDKESITVVWVDTKTGQPVQIEDIDGTKPDAAPRVIYSDIRINPQDVDDATFSTDVPKGYTAMEPLEMQFSKYSNEANLGEALGIYAEYTREHVGTPQFPDQIDNLDAEWDKLAETSSRFKEKFGVKPWFRKFSHDVTQFLQSLPKDGYAYLGKGKKLGQKDEIIFWYKKPDGGYRAMYGDIRTRKDIKPEDLPKK